MDSVPLMIMVVMAPLKAAVGITVRLVFFSTKMPGAWKVQSWGMLPLPESTLWQMGVVELFTIWMLR